MDKNTIYLLDGTSICYRSFYAIQLSTSGGVPSGAVYGFFKTLRKIVAKYNPRYMGICFDVSRKTFRQEKFKDYKIQRPAMPDELGMQMPVIKDAARASGITLIEKEGFEADDIIATISQQARAQRAAVVIVSSDKDMYQLLDKEKVIVYNPHRDHIFKEEDFLREYGFAPANIVDYLALTGDSTDNIPGAKGIGRVGAGKLIKEFGTVEEIFKNLDKISDRVSKILQENKKMILLSKDLVKLAHCDFTLNIQDLAIKEPDYARLYKIFSELEFKSFLKDIPVPVQIQCAVSLREGIPPQVFPQIEKHGLVFSAAGRDIYVFGHGQDCVYKTSLEQIKPWLADDKVQKITYDFKERLPEVEISRPPAWFDIKLAAYLVDSSFPEYELSTLIAHYLGQFPQEVTPASEPTFIYRIYEVLCAQVYQLQLEDLLFNVETPLAGVLLRMEQAGVKVDPSVMNDLLRELTRRLAQVHDQIIKLAGHDFNLNSPKQLREILFEELKIKPVSKNKTGYSTGAGVLRKLAGAHPVVRLILQYRELNKLQTTYVAPLAEQVQRQQGVLHAKFNQTATQTGRLSSSSPNLQSIPVKGEFSSFLRGAFVSSFTDGYLLSADYSQIELRLLAHFSGDERLQEAFRNNTDVHCLTASLLFGVEPGQASGEQRDLAKKINFGIVYGMSPYGLARELDIDAQQAQAFIDEYFLRYPRVKDYIQKVYKEVEEAGFVKTILGRRRQLADFKSGNAQLRDFARRQAINTPIQGSCADLIKVAMIKIDGELKKRSLKTRLIIQIHDELIFDVPGGELEAVTAIVRRNMETGLVLSVPVKVNMEFGRNWAERRKISG